MYRIPAMLFIALFIVMLVRGEAVAQPLEGELIGPFAKVGDSRDGVSGISVAPNGDIYLANFSIRDDEAEILAFRVTSGEFERVAGNGELGDVTAGPALETPLLPIGMAFGPEGDLYFFNGGRISPQRLARLRTDGQIEIIVPDIREENFRIDDERNVPFTINRVGDLFFSGGVSIGNSDFFPIVTRRMDGELELYSGCLETNCVSEGHRLQIDYEGFPIVGLYADGNSLLMVSDDSQGVRRGYSSVYKITEDGQASIVRTIPTSVFGGLGRQLAFIPGLGIIGRLSNDIIRFYPFHDDRTIDLGFPEIGLVDRRIAPYVYHEASGDLYIPGERSESDGRNQYLFRVPNVGETIRAQLEAGVEEWESYE